MFEFVLATLLVYGITNIIVRGTIFDGIKEKLEDWMIATEKPFIKWCLRKFLTLTNCPMCTGFWIGAIIGIIYGPFVYWNILFNGSLYSGLCWILHCITQFLGQGDEPERSLTVYMMKAEEEEEKPERVLLNE